MEEQAIKFTFSLQYDCLICGLLVKKLIALFGHASNATFILPAHGKPQVYLVLH